jgi:hypothetical protein
MPGRFDLIVSHLAAARVNWAAIAESIYSTSQTTTWKLAHVNVDLGPVYAPRLS